MIAKDRIVGPAVLAAVAGLSAPASAQLVYNPVALNGTDGVYGPGLGTGVTFNGGSFNATPVINNLGQVAFRANASSTGSPEGMWISGGGVNTNVALAGGPRPGGGTYPTASGTINQMAVNDSGEWFMRIGSATGVVSTTGGVPARLANTGDVAPGTGSATFATSAVANGNPYYNNAGQVAFVGNLTTGTGSPTVTITAPNANAQGLWIGTAASGVNLVLRQNDTNPLFDAGQTTNESRLGSFQTASMAFNNNGSYVLSANLQGANIITSTSTAGQNNGVILSNRSGSLAVVARAGAVAPDSTGAPSPYFFRGTTSSGLSSGVIGFNNNGHVAWVGGLRDSGTTSIATQALFSDNGGTLRLVGRGGTAMPTIYNRDGSVNTSLAGVNWAGFGSPVLSANDTLAFQASGNSVASVLLTMDTAGRMTSIVQSATVAIPNGAPLGGDALFSNISSNVAINRWNQMVFTSSLSGAGIFGGPGGNNQAYWAYDPALGVQLLARTQDLFTDALGNTHTIASIGGPAATGGEDGRLISLNDQGVVAITLYFTDGTSGIYTVAIPAPGAGAAAGLAGLATLRRRRR